MMLNPCFFVSTNSDKVREFKELLQIPIRNIELDLDELQTTNMNELLDHKVRQAYDKVDAPVIVEDTSLVFNAWNGLPGPMIKWFMKEMGVKRLVKALSSFDDKSARAVCGVGYTDGETIRQFKGMIEGKIVTPRGNFGFGWDCIFQPEGSSLTYGEMNSEQKNKISARHKALEKFGHFLKGRIN